MRNLTVYQRFAMIIAALSIAFFAVSALQILVLRDAVLDERRTTIHDMVDAATRCSPFMRRGQSRQDRAGSGAPNGVRLDWRHALGRIC